MIWLNHHHISGIQKVTTDIQLLSALNITTLQIYKTWKFPTLEQAQLHIFFFKFFQSTTKELMELCFAICTLLRIETKKLCFKSISSFHFLDLLIWKRTSISPCRTTRLRSGHQERLPLPSELEVALRHHWNRPSSSSKPRTRLHMEDVGTARIRFKVRHQNQNQHTRWKLRKK